MAVKSFIKELIHVGIPTKKIQPNEQYLDFLKIFITEPSDNPFLIEYVRFMEGTSLHPDLQNAPHISVKVDSIDEASKGCELLGERIVVEALNLMIQFVKTDGVIFELTESTKQ